MCWEHNIHLSSHITYIYKEFEQKCIQHHISFWASLLHLRHSSCGALLNVQSVKKCVIFPHSCLFLSFILGILMRLVFSLASFSCKKKLKKIFLTHCLWAIADLGCFSPSVYCYGFSLAITCIVILLNIVLLSYFTFFFSHLFCLSKLQGCVDFHRHVHWHTSSLNGYHNG